MILTVASITKAGNYKMDNGEIYNQNGHRRGNEMYEIRHLTEWTEEEAHRIKEDHYYKMAHMKISKHLTQKNLRNVSNKTIELFYKELTNGTKDK